MKVKKIRIIFIILLIFIIFTITVLSIKEKSFDAFCAEIIVYEDLFMKTSLEIIKEENNKSELNPSVITFSKAQSYIDDLLNRDIIYDYKTQYRSVQTDSKILFLNKIYYYCYYISPNHMYGIVFVDTNTDSINMSVPISRGMVNQKKINSQLYAFEYFIPEI